jgi:hypothetical protein
MACRQATKAKAAITILCDTPDEVEHTVLMMGRLLADHERVPLERMYDSKSRVPKAQLS